MADIEGDRVGRFNPPLEPNYINVMEKFMKRQVK